MPMTKKDIILSGIQPSGHLHIGNYFGAIKQWLDLQKSYQGIFCIVDYHAITVDYNPEEMQDRVIQAAIDYLACGIDPKKNIIFIQSQVPEHTELAWVLNTITPLGELERMTQFKEKSGQHTDNINAGLFDYPVLMAADILLYKAIGVPVGEDQVQHVELTRTIARKFNNKFGEVFPEPKVILSSGARIMSPADPTKKMSKSLGERHYISLSDAPEVVRDKIMKAVTDTGPQETERKKSPGVTNLFQLLELSAGKKALAKFEKDYDNGTLKYAELKEAVADALIKILEPIQAARQDLIKNPNKIKKILGDGAKKAQKIAEETISEVKEKIGFVY